MPLYTTAFVAPCMLLYTTAFVAPCLLLYTTAFVAPCMIQRSTDCEGSAPLIATDGLAPDKIPVPVETEAVMQVSAGTLSVR